MSTAFWFLIAILDFSDLPTWPDQDETSASRRACISKALWGSGRSHSLQGDGPYSCWRWWDYSTQFYRATFESRTNRYAQNAYQMKVTSQNAMSHVLWLVSCSFRFAKPKSALAILNKNTIWLVKVYEQFLVSAHMEFGPAWTFEFVIIFTDNVHIRPILLYY